ncbi:hypothetical protein D3C76_1620720 [compost metagenome]
MQGSKQQLTPDPVLVCVIRFIQILLELGQLLHIFTALVTEETDQVAYPLLYSIPLRFIPVIILQAGANRAVVLGVIAK